MLQLLRLLPFHFDCAPEGQNLLIESNQLRASFFRFPRTCIWWRTRLSGQKATKLQAVLLVMSLAVWAITVPMCLA